MKQVTWSYLNFEIVTLDVMWRTDGMMGKKLLVKNKTENYL